MTKKELNKYLNTLAKSGILADKLIFHYALCITCDWDDKELKEHSLYDLQQDILSNFEIDLYEEGR